MNLRTMNQSLMMASLCLLLATEETVAFSPSKVSSPTKLIQSRQSPSTTEVNSAVAPNEEEDFFSKSFVLPEDDIRPLFTLNAGSKEKIVNAFGVWTLVVSVITGPIWSLVMMVMNKLNNRFEDLDPNRALYDGTGKVWSRVWLSMTDSYPSFSGEIDELRQGQGPCLYVANHASWLDIPVICTVLDPVFKFISKAELKSVPCIGQQLDGGNHILIDREDRRSQLKTFKDGCKWLKNGVPLMAFPEGQRSPDGRLMDFKGGIFSMAVREKVPIIPISIANTHAVMPGNALFPVQAGKGKLHVHVHSKIDTDGKSEAELTELVRLALLSKLPEDQHPLPKIEEEILDQIDAETEKSKKVDASA